MRAYEKYINVIINNDICLNTPIDFTLCHMHHTVSIHSYTYTKVKQGNEYESFCTGGD